MPFLAIFGPFLGHFVELEGNKGLLVTGQSRRTWNVPTVSVHLAVATGFRGCFGPKKAVLGHEMRSFGKAPPDLPPLPQGTTAEFLARNLDLARRPPRLEDSWSRVEPEAVERSNGRNGKEKCCLLFVCLLACCLLACLLARLLACLLARFKGRGV